MFLCYSVDTHSIEVRLHRWPLGHEKTGFRTGDAWKTWADHAPSTTSTERNGFCKHADGFPAFQYWPVNLVCQLERSWYRMWRFLLGNFGSRKNCKPLWQYCCAGFVTLLGASAKSHFVGSPALVLVHLVRWWCQLLALGTQLLVVSWLRSPGWSS